MREPGICVRKVELTDEDQLYFGLIDSMIDENHDGITPYRLRKIIRGHGGEAFAILEKDRSLIGVQFYDVGELLTFGDDEPIQFMTMSEINAIREFGEIYIDGTRYKIKNATFNLVNEAIDLKRVIVFDLEKL